MPALREISRVAVWKKPLVENKSSAALRICCLVRSLLASRFPADSRRGAALRLSFFLLRAFIFKDEYAHNLLGRQNRSRKMSRLMFRSLAHQVVNGVTEIEAHEDHRTKQHNAETHTFWRMRF